MSRNSDLLVRYYQRTARDYDSTRFPWQSGPLGDIETESISVMLKGKLVLECGVGSGRLPLSFGKDYFFVGCDISKEMIKSCKKRLKMAGVEAHLVLADGNVLPFTSEAFDSVLCSRTFKFFSKPMNFLREANRVMKRGGRCLVSAARSDSFWFRLAVGLNLIQLDDRNSALREHYYSKNEINHLVQGVDFRRIDQVAVGNLFFGLYSFVWFNIYDKPFARMLRYLPNSLVKPFLLAGKAKAVSQALIICQK